MDHDGISSFLEATSVALSKSTGALIFAEDDVEIASTLEHALGLGFGTVALFCAAEIPVPDHLAARVHRVRWDIHRDNALTVAVNRVIAAAPGAWLSYGYNAEYLFFPFSETRTLRDLVTFQSEERRDAILCYVIDLYAGDLERHPNAVSLDAPMLDRLGYYALGREDPENAYQLRDRQMDFFGGLRWRFEEHVPWTRRRIDRVALFRAAPGLVLQEDHTFNIEEYNTYACPWHNNLTAAVCSFRTAKALRTNPGSRFDVRTFRWQNSVPFSWTSQQLMDLGLMEPGQWF